MQFNNYSRKEVSYEKQMQIAENKKKVEMTLECIRAHLSYAAVHNIGTDSLCRQIASVVDRKSDYFIDARQGPQTKEQKKMMNSIGVINSCAQDGTKMNFIVDMEGRKYRSACKDEDIGVCLCCLYPVSASRPIILLADENQHLGLYVYVGTPSTEGKAYLFTKEKTGSLFVQLQEFHFLSLRKDPVYRYDHGQLLSYNSGWGWKNISFSIILKENQDMVRELFDSVKTPKKSIGQQNGSNEISMGAENYFCPWQ